MHVEPIRWRGNALDLLDQRLLPRNVHWVACRDAHEVAVAIRDMIVRGAPAIGVSAAFGVALAAQRGDDIDAAAVELRASRPTAVNLMWALDRMIAACNAGALATAGYGTALGVIRAAVEGGKRVAVFADETRPYLQGARLTAWELKQENIDVTLITDSMAGHFFQQGRFDAVIVGADRIAANGDTANKIGTYTVAVLAHAHGVPFYVAAPLSTIDARTPDGSAIPIEERSAAEVTEIGGIRIAPEGIEVRHPAFDVTPARLIAAIITEVGVLRAPFTESIRRALSMDRNSERSGG